MPGDRGAGTRTGSGMIHYQLRCEDGHEFDGWFKDSAAFDKLSAAGMVHCPTCGGDSLYASDNPHRPFCSARCRNIDLGAWASESYRVASPPSGEDIDPDDPPHQ